MRRWIISPPFILGCLLASCMEASSQAYMNQLALDELLSRSHYDVYDLPEVRYRYHVAQDSSGLRSRLRLWDEVGRENAELLRLLNRDLIENFRLGDTLVVPDTFSLDLRAYSPFPLYYVGGRYFDKLIILDKTLQAFAAYRYGELERWGIMNTGSDEYPTPSGRYNVNWREEYRRSSLNWDWEMYWVLNFHHARGIHLHQYAMPTGGPSSRGCVRLVETDAKWLYHWADTWRINNAGHIVRQGTTVLVIGEEEGETVRPFEYTGEGPVLRIVDLPEHPFDVEPGTPQQEHFDSRRAQSQATASAW